MVSTKKQVLLNCHSLMPFYGITCMYALEWKILEIMIFKNFAPDHPILENKRASDANVSILVKKSTYDFIAPNEPILNHIGHQVQ